MTPLALDRLNPPGILAQFQVGCIVRRANGYFQFCMEGGLNSSATEIGETEGFQSFLQSSDEDSLLLLQTKTPESQEDLDALIARQFVLLRGESLVLPVDVYPQIIPMQHRYPGYSLQSQPEKRSSRQQLLSFLLALNQAHAANPNPRTTVIHVGSW